MRGYMSWCCRSIPLVIVPMDINTMTPKQQARHALDTRYQEYKNTDWSLLGTAAKKDTLLELIQLADSVISLDPEDYMAQKSRSDFQGEIVLMHAQYLEANDDIVQFARDQKEAIEKQAQTFEDDYQRLKTGQMDYATMRSLYG